MHIATNPQTDSVTVGGRRCEAWLDEAGGVYVPLISTSGSWMLIGMRERRGGRGEEEGRGKGGAFKGRAGVGMEVLSVCEAKPRQGVVMTCRSVDSFFLDGFQIRGVVPFARVGIALDNVRVSVSRQELSGRHERTERT